MSGPKSVHDLVEMFPHTNPLMILETVTELWRKDYIELINSTNYEITESGRARYVIDDNCRGW